MNNNSSTSSNLLPIKTHGEAVKDALSRINEERRGIINGLFCRWEGINRAKMKYWRFGNVTLMAGSSGSGKSAILNMLEADFTDPLVNPTFLLKYNHANSSWDFDGEAVEDPKIIVIAFKYEMSAADEVLRSLSGSVGKSYSYLLSAEKQHILGLDPEKQALDKANYNNITDEEYILFEQELNKSVKRPIIYVETAGNLEQMVATVKHARDSYPNRKIVITIDHTLLSIKLTEKDDLELAAQTAKKCIMFRKLFDAMVIPLGQLNGNIEDMYRRTNKDLHFPIKTDIHGSNQIYWACDDVVIWHRPELLAIEEYGRVKMLLDGATNISTHSVETKRLIHANWIKSRFNKSGHLWFNHEFEKGKIFQVREQNIRVVKDDII